MYKTGDIIIHSYNCKHAIAIVLADQSRIGEWISTEFISSQPERGSWNSCSEYIFKKNKQYNVPEEYITTTIGFMDIEGKIIIGPEDDDYEEDDDDWYEPEEDN